MKLTNTNHTFEITGDELAEKLGIEGCITSISYASTEKDDFESKITIQVKEL